MSFTLTQLQDATLKLIKMATYEHPITSGELIRATHATEERQKKGANMRQVIHALRVKGKPICANDDGYYWPTTLAQIDEYLAQLDGRIADIQRTRAGIKMGRHNLEVQLIAQQSGYRS